MTTKLTAAQEYAKRKSDQYEAFLENSFSKESLKGVELFEVKCPSEMTFKCRRLDAAFAANTGSMPMALSEQLLNASTEMDETSRTEAFNQMSVAEQRASIQIAAQMVRYVSVEPRIIVGDVGNRTDAISSDALTMADFKCLAEWAQTGGGEAPGLKTFRKRR